MASSCESLLLLSCVFFMVVAQAAAMEVLSLSSACTLSFTDTLNRSSTAIRSEGLVSCATATANRSGTPAGLHERDEAATTNCSVEATFDPKSNKSFAAHSFSKCSVLLTHESTPYLLSSDCAGVLKVTAGTRREFSSCVVDTTSKDEKKPTHQSYKVQTFTRCTSTFSTLTPSGNYTTISSASSCLSITTLKSGRSITQKSVSSAHCNSLSITPKNQTSSILPTYIQGSCSVNTTLSTTHTPSMRDPTLHHPIFQAFS